MAVLNGWDGYVKLGTTGAAAAAAHLNSWTIAFAGDALEKTAYGDKDREFEPGIRSAVVDFAGYYNDSDTEQGTMITAMLSTGDAIRVEVECMYATAKGYEGEGVLTALSLGGAVDALVPFSGSIQIAGGMSTV